MSIQTPSPKMIKHAELNANILSVRIPKNVLEDSMHCWWFNHFCWYFRPPREQDFVKELALCRSLGLEVDLSEFETKLDFVIFLSVVFKHYEASCLHIFEQLQSRARAHASEHSPSPKLSLRGCLDRTKIRLRAFFKRSS